MDAKRILIVEDDRNIALSLERTLAREGYQLRMVRDGATAKLEIKAFKPDLIILDWGLPDTSGLDILKWLRADSRLPVLMLTARDDVVDKVLGLESGADDYITKPFHGSELVARIRLQLRRSEPVGPKQEKLSHASLNLDVAERRATRDETVLDLTRTEFDLLEYFMRNPRIVCSREALLQAVWGYQFDGYQRTVDVHIRRLRSKLEPEPDRPRFIHSVRGIGYRFQYEEGSEAAPDEE